MAKSALGENWEHFASVIGVDIQKKSRPKIDVITEHLISDNELKNRLYETIKLLKQNKIKPAWFGTSHYKFKRKGEVSLQIKFGDGFKFRENEVFVSIHTTLPANIEKFEEFLTEEMRDAVKTIMESTVKVCNSCGRHTHSPCGKESTFEYKGKQYKQICPSVIKMEYLLYAHTQNIMGQFQMIDNFIRAKIRFDEVVCTNM